MRVCSTGSAVLQRQETKWLSQITYPMHLHNSRTSAAEARLKQPRQPDAKLNMQRPNIIKIKHLRLHGSRIFQPENTNLQKKTNISFGVGIDSKSKSLLQLA